MHVPVSSWPPPRQQSARYGLRLLPPGHHILSVLEPSNLQTHSIKIFTTTRAALSDGQLHPCDLLQRLDRTDGVGP